MSIIKQLYRRSGISFSDNTERDVGSGLTFNWNFNTPGYISFDFMCDVPLPSNGELPSKYFWVTVNGKKRFQVRGAWAWQRVYLYVDSGPLTVTFDTTSFTTGDSAKIRHVIHRQFVEIDSLMIESTSMPKPLQSINSYPILQGWQRYQRTGKTGTELEFVIVFEDIAQWKDFMANLEQMYVIKGDYGTYGGTILPQDLETVRQGGLIFTKCKMNSPLTAGVGVDGM